MSGFSSNSERRDDSLFGMGSDRFPFLFDDPLLVQDRVYREKCRIADGDQSVDLTLKRPFPSWDVIGLERFHRLYNKGHFHVRLLPNCLPGNINNRLPFILVMQNEDVMRSASHPEIAFSVDIRKLANDLSSAPMLVQNLLDDIDALDCTNRYVFLFCHGFNAFWEVLGYLGPLEDSPVSCPLPFYSPITEPISPESNEPVDCDRPLDSFAPNCSPVVNEPPPLIPINPLKDPIVNNNQEMVIPPIADLDQLQNMVTVLPQFRIPQSPAPRRKTKTKSRPIHFTLCCDPCKEIFDDQTSYDVHMQMHILFVDSNYPCPQCPFIADDEVKLESHIEINHRQKQILPQAPPPAVMKPPSNPQPLEMGLFYCRLCSHNSLQKNKLRNHVKFIHGNGMDAMAIRKLLDSMEL